MNWKLFFKSTGFGFLMLGIVIIVCSIPGIIFNVSGTNVAIIMVALAGLTVIILTGRGYYKKEIRKVRVEKKKPINPPKSK